MYTDGKTALLLGLSAESRARGLNLELSPPYQPSQNPYTERYGALITTIARQMIQDAGLPTYLWNKASLTAIYIQNRILHRLLD